MDRFTPIALIGLAISLLASSGALAQQPPPSTRMEFTAFTGRQSGEDFTDQTTGQGIRLHSADNAGLIVDVNMAPDVQLEFLYSRARQSLGDDAGTDPTDLKVEYLHVGGAYVYGTGHVRPFFSATLGATHLDSNAPGAGSDTKFSVGFGGGVKLFLTDNIGLRLEARAYATQVDSDSAVFCTNGACRIYYEGSFMWQYTGHAGITIAF